MNVKNSVRDLVPYKPSPVAAPVKLDANECPNYLFPGPVSLELDWNRYPDTNSDPLRDKLAQRYDLSRENFIIGNGSSDLLELVVKTYAEVGDILLTHTPSFSMYPLYAKMHGAKFIGVDTPDLSRIPMTDIAEAIAKYRPKLVFLCTPNNPTGAMTTRPEILNVVRRTDALVVVDEAYMEFTDGRESVINDVERYPNLVVARTFSKAYGLAAMRLGYLIANRTVIDNLLRTKPPYNVNAGTMTMGLKALARHDEVLAYAGDIAKRRDQLYQELVALDFDVVPSDGNFLYFQGFDDLADDLLEQGVLVRRFPDDYIRVTIGTKDETDRFLTALKEVL